MVIVDYSGLERIIKSGTILICPLCRKEQAVIIYDINPDKTFDWRVVKPFKSDAIIGVSYCCNERYITFSGAFYTDLGVL